MPITKRVHVFSSWAKLFFKARFDKRLKKAVLLIVSIFLTKSPTFISNYNICMIICSFDMETVSSFTVGLILLPLYHGH